MTSSARSWVDVPLPFPEEAPSEPVERAEEVARPEMAGATLEPFAGPGGASLGMHAAGLAPVGVEVEAWACATRAAAGLATIRADASAMPLAHLRGRIDGLWLSPPCPTFSPAGKGGGRSELAHLYAFAEAVARYGWREPWRHHEWSDRRTPLVLEVLRFAEALSPSWLVAEQVPTVVELWHAFAHVLGEAGYAVWAGILNAADYGVPQTRRRAILLASRGRYVEPPPPTHARNPRPSLLGPEPERWRTMHDALGWSGEVGFPRADDRGSGTGYRVRDWRSANRPAATVSEKARSWVVRPEGWTAAPIRVSLAEALVLQGFPRDYPVAGDRTAAFLQVANATPPPLAEALVRQVMPLSRQAIPTEEIPK